MAYKTKGDRYGSSWSEAFTSTQSRPYHNVLPYSAIGVSANHSGFIKNQQFDLRNMYPLSDDFGPEKWISLAGPSNKALSKVYDRLSQAESLLVAWKERQSAIDLVASNLGKLVRTARAIKRRDSKIIRAIKKRNPKGIDVAKDPAGLWLEYHFAIVPTIMDIHHAMGILGMEFPVESFSFSSMEETTITRNIGEQKYRTGYDHRFKAIVKLGGEIYALNPNVHLATMLGFGQPLSVAWEMTPFSWFVDYFVNVSQLAKNLEPRFPGVKVRNTYTTHLVKASGHILRNDNGKAWDFDNNKEVNVGYPTWISRYNSYYMRRSLGWPNFQLEFNSPLDLKGQQCSYIAAVLVGLLSSFIKT